MSPELEMLDQLLGGDLPISIVRRLFADDKRFVHAALAMLRAGEIKMVDADGNDVPKWKWPEALNAEGGKVRIQITDDGANRIA